MLALVTGGTKRIGLAICQKLIDHDIDVITTYLHDKESTLKLPFKTIQCDLTKLEDCDKLLDFDVDVLINNSSIFVEETLEQFDQYAHLHMRAPLYLGMKLGKKMKERGWGRIVNIIDSVVPAGKAHKNKPLYNSTKYGLYGLSQALAIDLAPEVTVNSICPGLSIPNNDNYQEFLQDLPLKKLVPPEELADAVLSLIKSESRTGTAVVIDAGLNIKI
jgi:NAD(P)-dependent dehydrogenase (short-subunit alcohol dehydrogenase family)